MEAAGDDLTAAVVKSEREGTKKKQGEGVMRKQEEALTGKLVVD